tara:strand:+ start:270 stop:713 length:444 start_codon:yes stop_codon:yes gene_type:complete
MANIVPDSFKTDLLKGTFDFKSSGQGGGDTFKLALFTSLSGFSTSTTTYTGASNEVANGNGYTTGGNTLTNAGVTVSSNVAIVDFDDTTFSSASITAVGALIYKSSSNNEAVLVLDFGGTKTSTSGDFQIVFPAASSSAAIIRVGDA